MTAKGTMGDIIGLLDSIHLHIKHNCVLDIWLSRKKEPKHVFSIIFTFLVMDEWLWWHMGCLFGVMSIKGTMGDIIG